MAGIRRGLDDDARPVTPGCFALLDEFADGVDLCGSFGLLSLDAEPSVNLADNFLNDLNETLDGSQTGGPGDRELLKSRASVPGA